MGKRIDSFWIGIFIIGIIVFLIFFISIAYRVDPFTMNLSNGLHPPSSEHLLGTDEFGRDFLSRIVYGARLSIGIGVFVVFFSSLIGMFLGVAAGYIGGIVDEIFSRIVDIFLAFPGILLALTIVSITGPGIKNIFIALVLTGWVSYGRLARGIVLKLRNETFVLSSKALGAGFFHIMRYHIIPFTIPIIIVQATLSIAGVVIAESGLSFLGVGVPIDYPSLGALINEGRKIMLVKPFYLIVPSIVLFLIIIGFSFLGEGLKDRLKTSYKSFMR